jgi:hypothetical protein
VEEEYILETVLIEDKYYRKSTIVRLIQEIPTPSKSNIKKSTEWFQVLHSTVVQSPKIVHYFYNSGLLKLLYNLYTEVISEN